MSKTALRLVTAFVLACMCGSTMSAGFAAGIDAPSVVVFPLVASQPSGAAAATKISNVVSDQITQLGGVNVKPVSTSTVGQSGYLSAARAAGADYYVSGYVTKVGDQYSVLEQLVRTKNGFIRWSETVMLSLDDSLVNEGHRIHDVILADTSNASQYPTPPTVRDGNPNAQPPVPAAQPGARTSAPAPGAAVANRPATVLTTAIAHTDGKTALIIPFTGRATDDVKAYVPGAFIRSLKKYGIAGERSELTADQLAIGGGQVACAETGATYLLGGSVLSRQAPPDYGGTWFDAEVTMTIYDCTDPKSKPKTFDYQSESGDQQTGIDIAVDRVLKQYLAH
jgi:TolB-like protein